MFQRVFLGEGVDHGPSPLADMGFREKMVMVPLIVLVFWIGIYPGPFLTLTDASLQNLAATVRKNSTAVTVYREAPELSFLRRTLPGGCVADFKDRKPE
jgi:NADH-quinone oxidoreductase subunit M